LGAFAAYELSNVFRPTRPLNHFVHGFRLRTFKLCFEARDVCRGVGKDQSSQGIGMGASDLIKALQNTLQGGGRPHMENRPSYQKFTPLPFGRCNSTRLDPDLARADLCIPYREWLQRL
jgi:hypothetical protein